MPFGVNGRSDFPASQPQPLVYGRRKTQVGRVAHDGHRHPRHVTHAGQVNARPLGRPMINYDQFPGRPGVALEGGNTLLGKINIVPTT